MSEEELLDIDEAGSWEPKENESRGKIRKYKCDCIRTKKECGYCATVASLLGAKMAKEEIEKSNFS